jgi:chemotaxis protein methyltransferase CheR
VTDPLAQIADVVRRETGIVTPPGRTSALHAAVGRAAPGLDPAAVVAVLSDPARRDEVLTRLIDEVTTKETSFIRDRGQLDAIGWHALLSSAQAAGSRAIRVWSAGCATGEEPYTLALLAYEAFGPMPPPVDVLGTDMSGAALAAAAAGRYGERAIRALGGPQRDRYLDRAADGSYLAGGRLRRLVRFRRHNLVQDPIPPAGEDGFDLILCRNVLIYFEQPLAARIAESLGQAVRPGGALVLGASDALQRTTARTGAAQAQSPDPMRSGPVSPRRVPPGPAGRPAAPGLVPQSRRPAARQPAQPAAAPREGPRATALAAAGHGDREAALAQVTALLAADPMDADAHYIGGLLTLEAGEPQQAVAALRRALYADTRFALAAFALGRAYDALGDERAARRAFEQVLRTLDSEDDRHEAILAQVDLGDIAAACRARLASQPRRSAEH